LTSSELEKNGNGIGGKSALTDLPPVDRYDQQRADAPSDDLDDEDLNDITRTLHGAKAILGKATYAANMVERNQDQSATQLANEKREKAEEREMRELLRMAAWDAQMTLVGGVQMTNEEAQKCRQHIIDHADEYADRAVKEGRIRADQKDEYKWAIGRIKEIEDEKRRGPVSAETLAEEGKIKRSQTGRAAQDDTG
jgi:hypothetical protein